MKEVLEGFRKVCLWSQSPGGAFERRGEAACQLWDKSSGSPSLSHCEQELRSQLSVLDALLSPSVLSFCGPVMTE